jgi:hypothetical protein
MMSGGRLSPNSIMDGGSLSPNRPLKCHEFIHERKALHFFWDKIRASFSLMKAFLKTRLYIKKVRCFKEKSSVLPLKGYYAGEEVLPDFCIDH